MALSDPGHAGLPANGLLGQAGLNQTQGVNLPRWQGKKVLAGEGRINYDVVTAFTASGYKNKACWSETGTGFAVYKALWFILRPQRFRHGLTRIYTVDKKLDSRLRGNDKRNIK